MSSIVNYIQPNKFISFEHSRSESCPACIFLKYSCINSNSVSFHNCNGKKNPNLSFTIFSDFPSAAKNRSYAISSFVETKGESLIAKSAVEFVEYPLYFMNQWNLRILKNLIASIKKKLHTFHGTIHLFWQVN